MKKYIVRLKNDFNEAIRTELAQQNIQVNFSAKVLPTCIGIEAAQSLEELQANPLFKTVDDMPIGTIDV